MVFESLSLVIGSVLGGILHVMFCIDVMNVFFQFLLLFLLFNICIGMFLLVLVEGLFCVYLVQDYSRSCLLRAILILYDNCKSLLMTKVDFFFITILRCPDELLCEKRLFGSQSVISSRGVLVMFLGQFLSDFLDRCIGLDCSIMVGGLGWMIWVVKFLMFS